jgi:hypothetical protein
MGEAAGGRDFGTQKMGAPPIWTNGRIQHFSKKRVLPHSYEFVRASNWASAILGNKRP